MSMTIPDPLATPAERLERLEARIVELSSQIAGATCDLLLLVGEFDAAEGAVLGDALDSGLAGLEMWGEPAHRG